MTIGTQSCLARQKDLGSSEKKAYCNCRHLQENAIVAAQWLDQIREEAWNAIANTYEQIAYTVATMGVAGALGRVAACGTTLGAVARGAMNGWRAWEFVRGAGDVAEGFRRVMSGDSDGWWQIGSGLVAMGTAAAARVPGACFVAGTAVATVAGPAAIESLRVGDRVLTEYAAASSTQVDPATWKQVALVIPGREGDARYDVRIVTLKPGRWIEETGAKEGAWVDYDLPEMGVEGPALVVDVRACPPIKAGRGRVVLSTYTRGADNVIDVIVRGKEGKGAAERLSLTSNHLLFSLDRFDGLDATDAGSWVAAGELKDSERIRTADGWAVVEAVNRRWRSEQVFNLEVEGEHTYLEAIPEPRNR